MSVLNENLMERSCAVSASSFHRILRPLNGRRVQPPDAENRLSGGVGGVTGAIPSPRPAHASRRENRSLLFAGGDRRCRHRFHVPGRRGSP
jgi:hypothetical protein